MKVKILSIKQLIAKEEGLQTTIDQCQRFQLTSLKKKVNFLKDVSAVEKKQKYYPPILKNYDVDIYVLLASIGPLLVEPQMEFRFGQSFNKPEKVPKFKIKNINYLYELREVSQNELVPIDSLPLDNKENLLHLQFPPEDENEINETNYTCRICLDKEDKSSINMTFICPCQCKGDGRFQHIFCLSNWTKELMKKKDEGSVLKCQICHGPLPQYIGIFPNAKSRPRYFKFIEDLTKPYMEIYGYGRKQMSIGTMRIGKGDFNWMMLNDSTKTVDDVHASFQFVNGSNQVFAEDNSKKYGTWLSKQNLTLRIPKSAEKSLYMIPTIRVDRTLFGFQHFCQD